MRWPDLLRAGTYTINYVDGRDWSVAHIWSLAVEEQFYLLWPVSLALLGRRRGMRVAAAVVIVSPLVRTLQYIYFPEHRAGIGAEFHTVADALACGCLLAGFRDRIWKCATYRAFLESNWFATVPALLLLELAIQPGRPLYYSAFGMTFLNAGITLCVDRAVRLPTTWSGRVLNARPLVLIGVLSYSIYLWQQVFVNRHATALWAAFPANIALALACAAASYYCVERPLIALARRSRGTPVRVLAGLFSF